MTDISAAEREAYDSVAYPTAIVSHLTPGRIAASGRFYGWAAPDPETASVLEIGCGDGLNIIGMAAVAPRARHVGFDLSEQAIRRGQALIDAAGLTNVELEVGDILAWPRKGELFDYIVCHGVYAWVPEPVQQALLDLIGACLAPGGVAYVSYDALPAAAPKVEIQRYIARRTAGIEDVEARVKAALAMLATLSRHQVGGSRLATQFQVLETTLPSFDAAYFFHDWLADHYAPPSLTAFAGAAGKAGLKVAGDAGLADLFTREFDDEALALLDQTDGWAERGEALDFLRGAQMFRRSYLVRADAPPPASTRLDGLYFSFDGGRDEVTDEETGETRTRFTAELTTFLIPRTETQTAVMEGLWQARPAEMSYAEIVDLVGDESDAEETLRHVCALGLVTPRATPPNYTVTPGDRPLASPLARAMLATGPYAITLRHARLVPNEPPTGHFVQLCDGVRDHAALAAEMSAILGKQIGPAQIASALADIAQRRVFLA